MTNLIIQISRYLMILLIAMDTYYNFRFFSMRDEEGKNRVCGRQLVCMFMLHFLANILICDDVSLLRCAGGIFPAVHLPYETVLQEQFQTARQQYVYAFGDGIYYPHKAEP